VSDSVAGGIRIGTPTGRGVILAAGLGSGMAFLDGTVVNVALKRIGEDLDATLAELQWISNGYMLFLSALVLLGGAAGDVFGTGVRVGVPSENIGGLTDSVEAPRFATVTGLAQYAAHRFALGATAVGGKRLALNAPGVDRLAQRVKTWLQDFL